MLRSYTMIYRLCLGLCLALLVQCASTPENELRAKVPWTVTGNRPVRAILIYLDGLTASAEKLPAVLSRLAARGQFANATLGHLPNRPKTNIEVLQTGKVPKRLSRTEFPNSDSVLNVLPLAQLVDALKNSQPGAILVGWGSCLTAEHEAESVQAMEHIENALEIDGWGNTLWLVAATPPPPNGKGPRSPIVDTKILRYQSQSGLAEYWLRTNSERDVAKLAMRLKFQPLTQEVYTRMKTAGGTHYVRTFRKKELAADATYSELIDTLPADNGPDLIAVLTSDSPNPLAQDASIWLWSPNLALSSASLPDLRWMDIIPGVFTALGKTAPDASFDGDGARLTLRLQPPGP